MLHPNMLKSLNKKRERKSIKHWLKTEPGPAEEQKSLEMNGMN